MSLSRCRPIQRMNTNRPLAIPRMLLPRLQSRESKMMTTRPQKPRVLSTSKPLSNILTQLPRFLNRPPPNSLWIKAAPRHCPNPFRQACLHSFSTSRSAREKVKRPDFQSTQYRQAPRKVAVPFKQIHNLPIKPANPESVPQRVMQIWKGMKLFGGDIISSWKLSRENQVQLTWQQNVLLRDTKREVRRTAVLLFFFMIPILGYLVPLVALFYPHLLPKKCQAQIPLEQKKLAIGERRLELMKEITDPIAATLTINGKAGVELYRELSRSLPNNFVLVFSKQGEYLSSFFDVKDHNELSRVLSDMVQEDAWIRKDGLGSMDQTQLEELCLARGLVFTKRENGLGSEKRRSTNNLEESRDDSTDSLGESGEGSSPDGPEESEQKTAQIESFSSSALIDFYKSATTLTLTASQQKTPHLVALAYSLVLNSQQEFYHSRIKNPG